MYFRELKQFPVLVWILIIGVFFSRGTYYMVWPFMALILYRQFDLNEWEVGLLLSSAAISAIFVGFYSGMLTDKLGRKNILIVAGVFSIISFSLLAEAKNLWVYAISMVMCSISKEIWDPAARALMSDLLPQKNTREFALHFRYFAINVGAAIGPLIGVWLGVTAQQTTFYSTTFVFVILTFAVIWGFQRQPALAKNFIKNTFSFVQIIKLLSKDHVFLLLVLANILVLFIFSHMDTSLIQYLDRAGMSQVVELISTLILTNAVTIIVFQFILLKLLDQYSLEHRVSIGVVLLALGQVVLAFNPIEWYFGWVVAIFIMSLGESILFPSMNVQVDRLAPENMKGAYFGAAALFSIGYALGPYIGGVILKQWNGSILFIVNFFLCALVLWLYWLCKLARRPSFESPTFPDQN